MNRVFVTGGSGKLGSILVDRLSEECIVKAPSHKDCDILDISVTTAKINSFNPNYVIHLAALVDTFGCEREHKKALDLNVLGTINMVKACINLNCKFIYVSSEYVFGGSKGNYTVEDRLDPINVYGKTKAAAEYIVSILNNYQIVRVPFIKNIYSEAFTDQYSSRSFIYDITDKLINNIFNNDSKIIHISGDRLSLYDFYKKNGINCVPTQMTEQQKKVIPQDTSLINYSI